MSKRPLRARAGRPPIVTRPPKPTAAPPTAASLTRLLSRPDRGPVILKSGSVRPSLQTYSAPLSWGWGYAFDFPAPPAGHVLWYQLSVDWCLWEWREYGPANNTSTPMRIDFGVSWAWELVANPYYFTDPLPRFVDGSDRYEFYTSISPGSSGWSAGWIAPTRTVTLTRDSKESDPTPLALLLGTKVDGSLRLWYRGRATDFVVNGRSAPGGWIYGAAPDTIHWAWAVELPRVSDATTAVQPPVAQL